MGWGEMIGQIIGSVGKHRDRQWSDRAGRREYRHQKYFAQRGIQWKVDDAIKAGIHPLYAIGGQAHSYKPQHVAQAQTASTGYGRAIESVMKGGTEKALTALNKQGLELDNEYKRLKNTELRNDLTQKRTMTNDLISQEPVTRNPSAPGNPGLEPGARSLEVIDVDRFGGIEFNLTQEASESKESVGFVRQLQDMGYDTIRAGQMAASPKMRAELKPVVLAELRRTNKIKSHQTIVWRHLLQRFIIVDNKIQKNRKPLLEFKKGYKKERDKREINEYWW